MRRSVSGGQQQRVIHLFDEHVVTENITEKFHTW